MGFKRTSEGRVFFQSGRKNETGLGSSKGGSSGVAQDNAPPLQERPRVPVKAPPPPPVQQQSASQAAPMPASAANPMQNQILSLLKSLNERLHASQSEREYLRGELETYKGLVQDLRHKADSQESSYKELAKKLEISAQATKKSANSERLSKETYKELEETRKILAELEEKSDKTEHDLKIQISQIRQNEATIKKKQAELENLQAAQQVDVIEKIDSRQKQLVITQNKKWEDLVSQLEKREKSLDVRISSAEQTAQSYDDKIEEALGQTAKLERKIDKATQDRVRFIRKLERIEETVIQTHDALNSQAMVLLTDRNLAAQGNYPHSQVGAEMPQNTSPDGEAPQTGAFPWWKRPLPLDAVSASGILVAAVLVGWFVSNIQKPDFSGFELPTLELPALPQMSMSSPDVESDVTLSPEQYNADLDLDFLAEDPKVSSSGESTASLDPVVDTLSGAPELDVPVEETESAEMDRVLDGFIENGLDEMDDIGTQSLTEKEKILEILEDNPDRVAQKLNAIEPGAATSPSSIRIPTGIPEQKNTALDITEPVSSVSKKPLPKPEFDFTVTERITPDANLPDNIKDIEQQAFNGSAEAQHDLAAIYTAGHGGVTQNYDRAALWFREASKNGVANASYNLGVLYHQGIGVAQNLEDAISWYQVAAERNHPEAQYNLGIAYIEGIGLPYDPKKASESFKSAASSGIMEAAYNLGLIYENGLLDSAQPDKALMWYKAAADKGSPEAKAALEQLAQTLNIRLDEVNKIVESMKKEASAG